MRSYLATLGMALAASLGCDKVPLVDTEAGFTLAEATWFEEEETLFVFYRLEAQQGLSDATVLELSYLTDDSFEDFKNLYDFEPVHTHVPVTCGRHTLCGSMSLHVARAPRLLRLRMRYHRDSELTLAAPVNLHIVPMGDAPSHRSLLVYGVFDESNRFVQWRARHVFPSVRNHEAQELGLRRWFKVEDQVYDPNFSAASDPRAYGYGSYLECPQAYVSTGFGTVQTHERAVFVPQALPSAASEAAFVCAKTTVKGANGEFSTAALALKNPEVSPAFPALRSPVEEVFQVKFFLAPCLRTISSRHRAMQVQRLLAAGDTDICIDDFNDANFVQSLSATLRERIDVIRQDGRDMIFVLGLHHDDTTGTLALRVQQALADVVQFEKDRSSPRLVGAFVFDSYAERLRLNELNHLALWCPSDAQGPPTEGAPSAPQTCAVAPDDVSLRLGPFSFGTLPILPSRSNYTTFVDKYSEGQAGRMKRLSFLAPVRTPLSENIDLDGAVATFFNQERITASPTDAFSYCPDEEQAPVVFRSADATVASIATLPHFHAQSPEDTYELGLYWDFPFLARLEYEMVLAGSVSAFSASIPFGYAVPGQAYEAGLQWQQSSFSLAKTLLQCRRFCTHGTFDSAAVYNLNQPFDASYADRCYRPRFPSPGDGGWPRDP